MFWLAAAAVALVVVTLTHVVAMRLSFTREPQSPLPKARLREQQALLGPVTAPEKGALLGFVLFVVGAFTVSWHQVNPAWLAAFILVALLLTGLVSKKDFQQKIDWPMIFFLLSLDGLQSLDQLPGARHRAECSSRQPLRLRRRQPPVVHPGDAGAAPGAADHRRHGGGGGSAHAGGYEPEYPPLGAHVPDGNVSDMWFKPYQSSQPAARLQRLRQLHQTVRASGATTTS